MNTIQSRMSFDVVHVTMNPPHSYSTPVPAPLSNVDAFTVPKQAAPISMHNKYLTWDRSGEPCLYVDCFSELLY